MSEELIEYAVRFKDIEGYAGLYQVTCDGRVFSKINDRFLKPVLCNTDYLTVTLCKNGTKKINLLHRLVADAFLENPGNKTCVDHINTNRTDNNVNNLRYASKSENAMNRNFGKNSKLQIKGITKNHNSFMASIVKGGKQFTKTFKKIEEAITWRKQKEEELHGEFAFKN